MGAVVLNVILNIIFVTVFHMRVVGVALTTIISMLSATILAVLALMRRTDACCLDLSYPVTWAVTFLCEMAVFLHIYRKNSAPPNHLPLPA